MNALVFVDLLSLLPSWMVLHAAALIVVTPLLSGPIALILSRGRLAWVWALGISIITFVLALVLYAQVLQHGSVAYAFGNWAPPLGIAYHIDSLNVLILLIVAGMGVLSLIYGLPSVLREIAPHNQAPFFAAFLLCLTGLMGVAITGDAFNVFVFLEISSISTYILVAMGGNLDRRALTASFNYLILGTIGATFFVIGLGLLYMATGTLNMADITQQLQASDDSRVIRAAFAFIVIGLGLKTAMFPLHTWLPNAYSYSPTVVGVFLASTATKVAFYAMVRFILGVFLPGSPFSGALLELVIAPLAVAAMIVCSVQALYQANLRTLLAYSSIAQLGYMLLGLSMGTAAGISAGLLHLFNHALMKGALFMAVGIFALNFGVRRVQDLRGLGKTMPLTAAAFTISGLSLIGMPLTAGFWGKYYLIIAALEKGWWWAVVALLVSSVLAIFYVGKMLEQMYLRPAPKPAGRAKKLMQGKTPALALAPLLILAAANIWFFFDLSIPKGLTDAAAMALLGGGAS
jgi:multicomponent Na+:H+ antiporter subunit D